MKKIAFAIIFILFPALALAQWQPGVNYIITSPTPSCQQYVGSDGSTGQAYTTPGGTTIINQQPSFSQLDASMDATTRYTDSAIKKLYRSTHGNLDGYIGDADD